MARKRTLLLVEDNPLNAELLSLILKEEYDTVWVQDGRQGLEKLQQAGEEISLILLDLMMPVMDGYEFLENLRTHPSLSGIPVIAMTQQGDESDEEKALALGAADFLTKPYKPRIIRHKIANIIKLRETAALVNRVEKDRLTGVLNKEFFYQKAEQILAENPDVPYTIFCFDLENFKLVNDLFGRAVGDELLRYAARMLADRLPEGGLCGRLGADTFVMLVPGRVQYGEEDFEKAAERLNGLGLKIRLSVRAGVYEVTGRDVSVSSMCDRAVLAADSIKGWYSKRFAVYDDEIRQKMLREQALIDDMDRALRDKQFEVWYQPKYRLRTNRIVGAEALVRWKHPQKGYLNPGDFIPLFERTGFITRLDLYVWEQVCADLADWDRLGCSPMDMSVNVSRADLYNPALPQILRELLDKYGLAVSRLHLEITETAYTEDPRQIIEVANELKKHGFVLEMDDFGSAYSSLNMLNELPIDLLKLDMKFLQNAKKRGGDKSILYFIIDLSKWMRLPVVAEGVETQEQADQLLSMDCEYGQGYFFSRPLPAQEYAGLLRKEKQSLQQREQEKKGSAAPEQTPAGPSKPVMLILEGQEGYRRLQQKTMETKYHLLWVQSEEEALRQLHRPENGVKMVLLDTACRQGDAGRTLQAIRSDPALAALPVLVSGPFAPGAEELFLGKGADDFLAKPYSGGLLSHHIQGIQARRRYRYCREEQAEEYRRLEEAANRDYLTGVLNRRGLDQAVDQMGFEEERTKSALYVLDLDDLKESNDRYGHLHGDKKLQAFASYLRGSLRAEDLVARIGGDEFVILMRQMPSEEVALQQGQRLCRELEQWGTVEGERMSCSVGATVFQKMSEVKQALARADEALYWAKRQGKGRCCLWKPGAET